MWDAGCLRKAAGEKIALVRHNQLRRSVPRREFTMLTIQGGRLAGYRRTSRRDFLSIGSLAVGGLSLPQLLHAEQSAGIGSFHKSVIMIYLTGGPPHQDMVDLKPEAPAEIRGEFQQILTNVPGIEISELMPRVASIMDKFAIIRSVVGSEERHSSFQCVTGRLFRTRPASCWPVSIRFAKGSTGRTRQDESIPSTRSRN